MKVTILKTGTVKNGVEIPRDVLLYLEKQCRGKEILGQVLGPSEPFKGFLNPDKTSHIIKNINYNPILDSLEGDLEFLPLPFGQQLELIYNKHPERIKFVPTFTYDDSKPDVDVRSMIFITMNVVIN
jgi:hypothetical protein